MAKFLKQPLHIVEKKKYWFIGSGALILIGLLVIAIWGLNLGIDFTGGATFNVETGSYIETSTANANEVKDIVYDALAKQGLKAETTQKSGSGSSAGYEFKMQLKINGKAAESDEAFFNAVELVKADLEDSLTDIDGIDSVSITYTSAGAVATKQLVTTTAWCLALALVLILVYIIIRFTLSSALSAVIALTHDVLVMLSVCAICRIQINTYFIAAILTIVGYSINNTIIVFDRVRENLHMHPEMENDEIINTSIFEMTNRMIHTSVTTLLVMIVLVAIGVSSIREFGFPIIIGLVAGTYSSIFIAGPVWTVFQGWINKIKADKKYKAATKTGK